MSDDKKKTGSPDNKLISPTEAYERRDWAAKYSVSQAKIDEAVKAVGHSAAKVKAYLGK